MAANTYGVTHATLQDWFPQAIRFAEAARIDSTLVTSWITRLSEDVRAALYQHHPNDEEITAASAPIAYAWLANTLAVGVAAKVGELAAESDPATVEAWRNEYATRLERLTRWPKTVLGDLSTFRSTGWTVSLDR